MVYSLILVTLRIQMLVKDKILLKLGFERGPHLTVGSISPQVVQCLMSNVLYQYAVL